MEPHETFTWYDADTVKIKLNTKNKRALENGAKKVFIAKEQIIDYPTKRNRRIALKRYLIAALIIGGIAICLMM